MKKLLILCICLIIASCSNDDDSNISTDSLLDYIANKTIETGAVIACAASEEDTNAILTFFYPEAGATNIRFYETENAMVENLEYSNYNIKTIDSEPVFNGALRRYRTEANIERWIIITYELDNEIKISNPIRTKQITKPSIWNDEITIDQTNPLMPIFNWELNAVGDNAIYFQVISSANNDLISGTYTLENMFQFYNLSNVVLNITTGIPQLESVMDYQFTLMDVSLDNWVNIITLNKNFTTQ